MNLFKHFFLPIITKVQQLSLGRQQVKVVSLVISALLVFAKMVHAMLVINARLSNMTKDRHLI